MNKDDYKITYKGDNDYEILIDGEVKIAGENLKGMIVYTYFPDGSEPEIGWTCMRKELMLDYFPKVQKDIQNGNINYG